MLSEFRFNPGTTIRRGICDWGLRVGIAAAIAITANGGKDGERSDGEEVVFWSGVTLAAAGLAVIDSELFYQEKFSREKYDFRTIQIGGY